MKITLPFPPSVNGLYATDFKTKRRFKTKRYEDWLAEAKSCLWAQYIGTRWMESYHCPCKLTYTFGRPDKRTRDLSNYFKGCDDFLVSEGVLKDDSDIHEIHAKWGDVDGVVIEIEKLG